MRPIQVCGEMELAGAVPLARELKDSANLPLKMAALATLRDLGAEAGVPCLDCN